jgi:hypothetical protein
MMNKTPSLPEDLSADDRRLRWEEREVIGLGIGVKSDSQLNWDYEQELLDILKSRFCVIEAILGRDNVAPYILGILHSPKQEYERWQDFFESPDPAFLLKWSGLKLIENAGIYGVYGVTPSSVAFEARQQWVERLAQQLECFRELVEPNPQGSIARIIDLALSRYAVDSVEGHVDVVSLSILGGVTEGRIRNILSASDGGLEKIGQGISAVSAAAWLKGRKEFFASIWQQPDDVAPQPPSSDFIDEVVFVPIAADGSHFHPALNRAGKFTVGAKGEERQYSTFEEALAALQRMSTPRWRRPNETGNWGIVSGRDWKRIELSQLKTE